MASVLFQLYSSGKAALITDNPGKINWKDDTIVAVLLKPTYVFNPANTTWADIVAHQITDANYSPIVVTGKTCGLIGEKVRWSANTLKFGDAVTISAKTVVLLKRSGAALAAADQLICAADLNSAASDAVVSSTTNLFQITLTNGLFDI